MLTKTQIGADCLAFLQHWKSLCTDDVIPTSTVFLERPSPRFSPHVAIWETNGDAWKTRLHATKLVAQAGRDATGEDFLSRLEPREYEAMKEKLRRIIAWPCGYFSEARLRTQRNKAILAHALVLPLATGAGMPSRVVGYKTLIGACDPHEYPIAWETTLTQSWIDIGRGSPPGEP